MKEVKKHIAVISIGVSVLCGCTLEDVDKAQYLCNDREALVDDELSLSSLTFDIEASKDLCPDTHRFCLEVSDKKVCSRCDSGKVWNSINDKCEKSTCQNNILDEGEVCDIVDGITKFAQGYSTCQKWFDENEDANTTKLLNVSDASPGCSQNCKALTQNTCKTEPLNLCKITKESCEDQQKDFDKDKCECKDRVQVDTCGDGKLDDGEVCDVLDGIVIFAEGKGTCQLWYEENKDKETSPLIDDPEAKPGCASTCKAHSRGTCKTEAAVLCGNGKIDDNEVCDIGMDGQAKTEDDVIIGKTCQDYDSEVSWKEDGKPSCAKDCKSFGKGTCVEATMTGGVSECKATVEYSAESKKATATVKVDSESEYFTTVLCAPKNHKLAAAISKDRELTASSEFDASVFSDAGDYACIVIVVEKENGNRSLCSPTGDILKIGDGVETFENAACGTFTLKSQVAVDTLAKWTFVALDKNTVAEAVANGITPDEGSENSLLFKYNKVGENVDKITLSMTADGSGMNALTAFQIRVSAAGDLGEGQSASTASHIAIGTLTNYSISSMKMSAKYGKKDSAKVYVTATDGVSESIITEVDVAGGDYKEYEVTGFAAGTNEIHIYGDNTVIAALSLDDLTLVGSKE